MKKYEFSTPFLHRARIFNFDDDIILKNLNDVIILKTFNDVIECNVSWKLANMGLEATNLPEKGLKVRIFARKPDLLISVK